MNENRIMRILRESHDYSQDYVGSVLGIEQNTYSKLESGQIRLTVDRVKKLAELYKVEQDIFLSDTLPVINYNNGSCSHSNSVYNPQNYTDIRNEVEKEFMDRLLEEKDKFAEEKNEQIRLLQSELEIVRNEKEQLINLLEKLTDK